MNNNILESAPFWSTFASVIIAQLCKPIVNFCSGDGWKPKLIFSNGGMPSSHTAAVSALSISIGLTNGFASDIFILAFVFLLIVMNDAMNVRLETGKHSQLLNEWSEIFSSMFKDFSRQNLKTMVGHTVLQVFWGMILGIATAIIITLGFFNG